MANFLILVMAFPSFLQIVLIGTFKVPMRTILAQKDPCQEKVSIRTKKWSPIDSINDF